MRVVVGRIGRPHGIRGEVSVEPRTDEPEERFAPGAVLFVDGPVGSLVVERAHWHSGRLLIAFRGVGDRNAAEALRGLLLQVERGIDDVPDDPDEFYDDALIGCIVVRVNGERVGVIEDVAHLPAQDLLIVRADDDREVLIPFVTQFVPTVDIRERRVVVDPPMGLLEDAEGV